MWRCRSLPMRTGHCLHLLERDCSLQRRHQKVHRRGPRLPAYRRPCARACMPTPWLGHAPSATRTRYYGVRRRRRGMLFPRDEHATAVEHPVHGDDPRHRSRRVGNSRIASGEALHLTQRSARQWPCFEARLYAEDPRRGFLPTSGRINELIWPGASAHVRIDAGIAAGDHGGHPLDALLAKLIVVGADRESALTGLRARWLPAASTA